MDALSTGLEKNIKRNYVFSFLLNLNLTNGLWVIYLAFKGMSLTQIGLLEAIFHVTSLTMEVPTGAIADLFGRKLSRTLGRVFSLISVLILVGSDTFSLFALFMIFAALSYNLESGAGDALLYDSLKQLEISYTYMSVLSKQEAIFQITSIIAFLVGGLLGTYNYYLAFSVSAGIVATSIIYSLLFVEPPFEGRETTVKENWKIVTSQIIDSLRVVSKTSKVAYLIVTSQSFLALCTCVFYYTQNYWKGEGKTELEIGIFLAVGALAAATLVRRVNSLENFLGERRTLTFLPLCVVLSLWALAALPWKAPFFVILSVSEAMLFVVSNDYINKLVPSKNRATIGSLASMVFSVVMILVFPAFGKVADIHSFKAAFSTLAAFGLFLYGVNLLALGKLEV